MIRRVVLMLAVGLCFSGCVARAAYDVGTAPIRATGKVVDWTTTSKSEADRNRGRRVKKACDEERKAARRRERETGYAQPLSELCR